MKYYEVSEMAQKLDIAENTLRKYIREERVKAVKVGKRYIISEENYNKFINGK